MPTVAEVLVDTLVRAGVRRVLGIVGDSLNGVTDVIRARDDIAWVGVRHEEVAAFAALLLVSGIGRRSAGPLSPK